MSEPIILDCTLRDGGYYNAWDFDAELIQEYLNAMRFAGVEYVEFGFRSLNKNGFMGGCAYSTDSYINKFVIPECLKLSVMVNGSELLEKSGNIDCDGLKTLFGPASESFVSLVRIATHFRDLEKLLPVTTWLKDAGYMVALNLMQVDDRSDHELAAAANTVSGYPVDVLYFADSLGSMNPERTKEIVRIFQSGWAGSLGIHAHDNMSRALVNSVAAVEEGVAWVDGTITGMGRGPGNAKTELLVLEFEHAGGRNRSLTDLFCLVRKRFEPMKTKYGWGVNPFYYLAGKYGIHPTFVQNMLNDARYGEEDILSVIDHLRAQGGRSFNETILENAQNFYIGSPGGAWSPKEMFSGRDVLIVGNGPGTRRYKGAIEQYIDARKPIVVALNAQHNIEDQYIDVRIACHPLRLLADCEKYHSYPEPLITPLSQLPDDVSNSLGSVNVRDYGISVQPGRLALGECYATVPKPLVFVYALATAASGDAKRIFLAGFDGYDPGDPRNDEMDELIGLFLQTEGVPELRAITPTRYKVACTSVFAFDGES